MESLKILVLLPNHLSNPFNQKKYTRKYSCEKTCLGSSAATHHWAEARRAVPNVLPIPISPEPAFFTTVSSRIFQIRQRSGVLSVFETRDEK